MNFGRFLKVMVASSVFAGAGTAYAAPCGNGLNTLDMTIVNATYSSPVEATHCYGAFNPGGKSNPVLVENYLNSNGIFGGGWDHVVKNQAGGGLLIGDTIGGIQFSLSSDASSAGNFKLTLTDTNGAIPFNLPVTFDLLGVLKTGSGLNHAAYFFDDIKLKGDNDGKYSIAFNANKNGVFHELSHMNILVRDGRNEIPEPASLSLLGMGIIGALMVRRRSSPKKSK